jgi:hypothetical protein
MGDSAREKLIQTTFQLQEQRKLQIAATLN